MASSAVIIDTQNSSENSSSNPPQNNMFALVSLTSLFFMWGFITCLNDILIPYLKGMFDLSYTQAMLIQFCFFGAYFIVSLPAGALVSRLGYKKGIVTGLSIASLGCLLFYPAAEIGVYAVFLLALFVLATGITILQVSANPYVSALGPSKTASSRLTLTQAFNSFGTTVAPFFGAWLIFSGVESSEAVDASSVQIPYIAIALTLMVLAGIFALLKLPNLGQNAQAQISPSKAWQFKHLRLGAVGIFVYVGAEVAIGSFLINFLAEPTIAGITEAEAAKYISYYWGGAMVGRFIGAGVLCLAIVGGAILPLVQGALADMFGIQLSFVLPIFCYAFIVYYALIGSKPVASSNQIKEGGKHEAI